VAGDGDSADGEEGKEAAAS